MEISPDSDLELLYFPRCGVDYCEACGDCLKCDWYNDCAGIEGDYHLIPESCPQEWKQVKK